MPQEPYNPITTLVVLTALFLNLCVFPLDYPDALRRLPGNAPDCEEANKGRDSPPNEIDRLLMPEELETAAKVISLDNHENAIS